MMRRIALALLLVATACGGTNDETAESILTPAAAVTEAPTTVALTTPTTEAPPTEAAPFPVTVDTSAGPLTIDDRPERIMSLSPTATEILFAVGAGAQVVAVDNQSNYPADAPITDIEAFTPNIEAIAEFDPDMAVIAFDPGDLQSSLEALGVTVLVQFPATTLDDTYAQIDQLGVATGNAAGAADLVAEMQAELASIAAATPAGDGLTYYHELDGELYSVTSSTFIGELYGLLGLTNVADPADEAGFGYPQLNQEYLLAEDPDLIFLADTKCCAQTADTVSARPGWNTLKAVNNETIFELDDDIASRWGPRVVDFVRSIADALNAVPAVTS